MDTPAIVMMIVALVTVWGGMAAALVHLSRHPEQDDPGESAAGPQR